MAPQTKAIKNRMLSRLLPLVAIVILLMTMLTYMLTENLLRTDYDKQRHYIVDNAVLALDLINAGFSMLDTHLEGEMEKDIQIFKALYEHQEPPHDLASIKAELDHKYDLLVIDHLNTIVDGTMPEALGFNFDTFDPELGAKLHHIRQLDSISHEKIRTNVGNGELSKFSYVSAADNTLILELVYSMSALELSTQSLDPVHSMTALMEASQILLDIAVYDIYGYEFSHKGALYEPTHESLKAVLLATKHGRYEETDDHTTTHYVYVKDDSASALSDQSKVIVLTFSDVTVTAILRGIAFVILIGGALVLAVTSILLYTVVERMTKPISALTTAALQVAAGDYDILIPEGEPDEIGKLSRIFNTMVQQVNANYATIENKFKTTLLSMRDGMIATDTRGNIELMNSVAEKLTGHRLSDSYGKPVQDVFTLDGSEQLWNESPLKKDLLHTLGGESIPIEYSISHIIGTDGAIIGQVIVFRDISDQNEKIKRIEYLSYTDQLTGLHNRHYFEEAFRKSHAFPLSLLLIDVNGLKLINDAFGHQAGDDLLKATANILLSTCRQADILSRIGGDEFVVLMPNTPEALAEDLISKIQKRVSETVMEPIMLSLSIGYATQHQGLADIDSVFKSAEDDMYRKKLSESLHMRKTMIERVLATLHKTSDSQRQHSESVAQCAYAFGRYLGFDDDTLALLKRAAFMHDIGKIALHLKRFDASKNHVQEQHTEIERHPEIGYHILKSVNEYVVVSEIVLAHHEKYDGSGYPRGLKGDEIPKASQVIHLANRYDHLKRELNQDHAAIIEAISLEAHTTFDPELAHQFIHWLSL